MGMAKLLGATGLLGASALAYGVGYERNAFTLRRLDVPVLARGASPFRLLHLSDLHMLERQKSKQEWLSDLGRLVPDLVVLTGDVLSSGEAGPSVLKALDPLLRRPGIFVPGNNDYFEPVLKSPTRYLAQRGSATRGTPIDWPRFARQLVEAGWQDLTNARIDLKVAGRVIDVRGVDDPYLRRDRLDEVRGPADPAADLRLGIAHAPEPRILDAYTEDGVDLLLAGHTHGGQVCLPGYGALVTNCGIDRKKARGLSRYGAGGHDAWLHVSAGIGTSPYAPVRFACRPEATLLTLSAVR
jgi:predicted MPP superfamily phosphohydrolase